MSEIWAECPKFGLNVRSLGKLPYLPVTSCGLRVDEGEVRRNYTKMTGYHGQGMHRIPHQIS